MKRSHPLVLLLCLGPTLALAACTPARDTAPETGATPETSTAPETGATEGSLAKNIILMVSDGSGYNHIQATDYYSGRPQAYEGFPVQLAVTTYEYYDPRLMWEDFTYAALPLATDSAAAATAMASGIRTSYGAVGVDNHGNAVELITERAEAMRKATGVVTSVPWSHATPAAFVAHNASRDEYAAIAQEMIRSSATDVIMGAGNPDFDDDGAPAGSDPSFVGGATLWRQLNDADPSTPAVADADGDGSADPWTLIQTRAEFEALATMGAPPARVCGTAQVYTTLQQARSGDAVASPFSVPLNVGVPKLSVMAQGALNVLQRDSDGFFLLIEGGAADWASHFNLTGRMLEEQVAFNEAVEAVVAWVDTHGGWSDNLLIVTADHETGMLWGPGSGAVEGVPTFAPLTDGGAGVVPGVSWSSIGHTNQLVPLYAIGDASALLSDYAESTDPVRGPYIDNTDLARVLFRALR
jgi:alkaline phosphatase